MLCSPLQHLKFRFIETIPPRRKIVILSKSEPKLRKPKLQIACQYMQYEIISDTKRISELMIDIFSVCFKSL